MGFYGNNITNVSGTGFQFDKIYSNKYEMDRMANWDDIVVGRYVLVEYDQAPEMIELTDLREVGKIEENNIEKPIYSAKTKDGFPIEYGGKTRQEKDNKVYYGDICYCHIKDGEYNSIEFYKCIDGEINDSANFIKDHEMIKTSSNYMKNLFIDETYSNDKKRNDSTIFVKTIHERTDGTIEYKYLGIANLNTKLPSFTIFADAPTPEPIPPHFDQTSAEADYYNMHVQSSYGFRVKEAPVNENTGKHYNTDTTTIHYIKQYNSDGSLKKDETGMPSYTTIEVPAAIYFNSAGFDKNTPNTKDEEEKNYIKIEPTGKSVGYEKQYKHYPSEELGDIQELSINLPIIGNVISEVWDVIKGTDRQDGYNSLIGRLSFLEEEIKELKKQINSNN